MTDQEKALVKKDLVLCLKLNSKLGDYQNLIAVQKVYNWIEKEPKFQTVIGKRYVKRLGEVLEGKTDFVDCVLCKGVIMDGTAICAECLQKYRNLIPRPADQKIQTESGTVQKMTAFSRQAATTAKQMGVAAKDNFNTVSAKISEFTEENETMSVARDKLKGLADSGMEKLQENPAAAKAVEKGKEQAKKARKKWLGMSKKKRMVAVAVCVLLLLGGISGVRDGRGIGGGSIKIESAEDAMRFAETLYPETEGYHLQAGGGTAYTASDFNDYSKKSLRAMFNLNIGESWLDQKALENAYKQTDFSQDFTCYFIYIYNGRDHIKDCMIGEDGSVIEITGEDYRRVR